VWVVGDLSFRYSPKAGRVNIEDQLTLQTATILVTERKCTSGDMEFGADKGSSAVFKCPKWQIECDLSTIREAGFLTLRFLKTGIEIRLPAPGA
jgi:hypothetical protein